MEKNDLENWYVKYQAFNSMLNTDKMFIFRKNRFKQILAIEYDFSKLPDKIKIVTDIISKYKKTYAKDNLSDFLTYVWSNNCSDYLEIMNILYPNIRERKMYIDDESILSKFPKDLSMIKVLTY